MRPLWWRIPQWWTRLILVRRCAQSHRRGYDLFSLSESDPYIFGAEVEGFIRCLNSDGRPEVQLDSGESVIVDFDGRRSSMPCPGERVRAAISRKSGKTLFVRVDDITEKRRESRAEPECKYFGPCSGCTYQHLMYEVQLSEKEAQALRVVETLGFEGGIVQSIIPCPQQYGYRTKMSFAFRNKAFLSLDDVLYGTDEGNIQRTYLGYPPVRQRFEAVVPVLECSVQDETGNRILQAIGRLCQELGLEAFDKDLLFEDPSRAGLLRMVSLRRSTVRVDLSSVSDDGTEATKLSEPYDAWQVEFVTSRDEPDALLSLAQQLVSECPEVRSVGMNVKSSPLHPNWWRQQLISDESDLSAIQYTLHGWKNLPFFLSGMIFQVSPHTWISPNFAQSEHLYNHIVSVVSELSPSLVYDVYCGAGFATLTLARALPDARVVGIDMSGVATRDAKESIALNGAFPNVEIKQGEAHLELYRDHSSKPTPPSGSDCDQQSDVVVAVLMAPRSGLSSALISTLVTVGPARVVYASCNPSTLERDLRLLTDDNIPLGVKRACSYKLTSVLPIDTCPNMPYFDIVCVLDAVVP
mmetsp:Transcript_43936/g.71464  ORF Transcript_43936/g.71464 Transcript_43936/m.71464 type:complete len:581 (+) Transcript_43936:219-1961(+)